MTPWFKTMFRGIGIAMTVIAVLALVSGVWWDYRSDKATNAEWEVRDNKWREEDQAFRLEVNTRLARLDGLLSC